MLEHSIITYFTLLEMLFHMVSNGFRGWEGSLGLGRGGLDDKEVFGPDEVDCRTMMMMHSLEVSGFPRKHLDGSSPNSSLFYSTTSTCKQQQINTLRCFCLSLPPSSFLRDKALTKRR